MDLKQKHCIPCEGGVLPLEASEVSDYIAKTPGWTAIKNKKIRREFKFKNFLEAMGFVNRIADIAESEGHHPDIYISYNKMVLELATHAIGGLSENDFILAAKINAVVTE